jgi:uncharacterized protein YraI
LLFRRISGPRPLRIIVATLSVFLVAWLLQATTAAALTPGTQARVRTDDGACLNMRAQPSIQGTIVTCVPDGSTVDIQTGSVPGDGFEWQRIGFGTQSGWSVDQYLQALTAAPPPIVPATTGVPTAAATALPTPALTGSIPSNGGFGLAVWGGGPIDRIPPLAAQRGCTLRAVWVTLNGDFVGYIFGAPGIVNAPWAAAYPDNSLAANTAIIVVCVGNASPPPTSTPPPNAGGPVATPGVPPGIPNTPPGPAGNG